MPPTEVKKIKIPVRVADITTIPEAFRHLYAEQNGEHVLDKDIEIEDVQGLKSALTAQRDETRREREEKNNLRTQYGDADPAEIQRMREERAAEAQRKAEEKGEYQRLISDKDKKHETDLANERKKTERFQNRLKEKSKTSEFARALGKFEGVSLTVMEPHFDKHTDVVFGEDGEETVVVIDPKTKKVRLNANGENMTVAELATELSEKEEFSDVFKSPRASGSGGRNEGSHSTTTGNASAGGRKKVPAGVNMHDPNQYQALQKEANKTGTTYVDEQGSVLVAPQPVTA